MASFGVVARNPSHGPSHTHTNANAPASTTVKQVCQYTRAHSKATHHLLTRPRSCPPRTRYCPRAWRSSTADVDFEEGLLRYQNVSNPPMYPICFARPTWYSQSLTASSCLATPCHLMLSTPTTNKAYNGNHTPPEPHDHHCCHQHTRIPPSSNLFLLHALLTWLWCDWQESYPFNKVGVIAQELLLVDGLENWVRAKMTPKSSS